VINESLLTELTDAQRTAVTHGTGPLLIVAGAGTGKTTVLTKRVEWLIQSQLAKPAEILALTFTDKAAAEMETRLDVALPLGQADVAVHTFHSFGRRIIEEEAVATGLPADFSVLSEPEQQIFLGDRLSAHEGLKHFRPLGNPFKFVEPIVKLISRAKDELVSPADYRKFSEKLMQAADTDEAKIEAARQRELAAIYAAYEQWKREGGVVDYGDLITRVVDLLRERSGVRERLVDQFRFILVDEFQDTNVAQYELVKLLLNDDKNLTVVGDDDQCLPRGTRVLVPSGTVPIEQVSVGDEVVTAIGKGELGVSRVSHVFRRTKSARVLTFVTESGARFSATDNHKLFCRIERGAATNGHSYVYLMERRNLGWRIGVTNDLITRLALERSADRIIGIKACASEAEARYFETLWSLMYGLPMTPFKPRKGMQLVGPYFHQLFAHLDTQTNAERLAMHLGISLTAHHDALDGVRRGGQSRVKVILTMCDRGYRAKGPASLHRSAGVRHAVTLETSDDKVVKRLDHAGISCTKAKRGWRTRRVSQSLREMRAYAERLQTLTGAILEVRCAVGRVHKQHKTALVIPASNVLPGMLLPVVHGANVQYERVVEVQSARQIGTVYDLEIDRSHNYIANSVVVHNSIYKFRGAAVSNILGFLDDFPSATRVVLTDNFRSTQPILDAAYRLIQHNNPDRLEPKLGIRKRLVSHANDDSAAAVTLEYLATEADEAARTVALIQTRHGAGVPWHEIAVLARSNTILDDLARVLAIAQIPFVSSADRSFALRPEVRGIVAFLKVLAHPTDSLSLLKLALSPFYRADPDWLLVFNDAVRSRHQSLHEVLGDDSRPPWDRLSEPGRVSMIKLRDELSRYRRMMTSHGVGDIVYQFLNDHGALQFESLEDQSRIANLSVIFEAIRSWVRAGRDPHALTFVAQLDQLVGGLKSSAIEAGSDHSAVQLLTVHAAKGLEFDTVLLPSLIQGRFPATNRRDALPLPEALIRERLPTGDEHLEEERRLAYVAMTRAKRALFLTAAANYGSGGRIRKLSPFVSEALTIERTPAPTTVAGAIATSLFAIVPTTQFNQPLRYPEQDGVITLSPAKIESYLRCPNEFYWRHVLRSPSPPTAVLVYGNAVHAGIEAFHRLRREGITDRELLASGTIDQFRVSWQDEGFVSARQAIDLKRRGETTLTHFLTRNLRQSQPSRVESWVHLTLDQTISIRGRIDALWLTREIEVRDYKTSEGVTDQKTALRRAKNNLPLMIYGYAIRAEIGRAPDRLILDFVETDQLGVIEPTNEQLDAIAETVRLVTADIRAGRFEPNPDPRHPCDVCHPR
jgi:DNA helicase-2/ATP-dependent DNA helicase PcrA